VRDRQAPAGAKDEFSRTHFTRCWPQSRLFSREPVTCPIEMRFTSLGAIVNVMWVGLFSGSFRSPR
jgi:hypothetical protein